MPLRSTRRHRTPCVAGPGPRQIHPEPVRALVADEPDVEEDDSGSIRRSSGTSGSLSIPKRPSGPELHRLFADARTRRGPGGHRQRARRARRRRSPARRDRSARRQSGPAWPPASPAGPRRGLPDPRPRPTRRGPASAAPSSRARGCALCGPAPAPGRPASGRSTMANGLRSETVAAEKATPGASIDPSSRALGTSTFSFLPRTPHWTARSRRKADSADCSRRNARPVAHGSHSTTSSTGPPRASSAAARVAPSRSPTTATRGTPRPRA